jgi:prepilin-type N-terminal cleavage/methylation domain-containing protein
VAEGRLRRLLRDTRGFTLLELIIVMVILSIMALVVAPRVSVYMSGRRSNFTLLSSTVEKAFDDAFINNRTGFLVFHLYEGDNRLLDYNDNVFSRTNAVSAVVLTDNGKFAENPNRLLARRNFPASFKLQEAVLPSGEVIGRGNVMVPFRPAGYSDDVIIHILVNDSDRYSLVIHKFQKEADILSDFATFETLKAERR